MCVSYSCCQSLMTAGTNNRFPFSYWATVLFCLPQQSMQIPFDLSPSNPSFPAACTALGGVGFFIQVCMRMPCVIDFLWFVLANQKIVEYVHVINFFTVCAGKSRDCWVCARVHMRVGVRFNLYLLVCLFLHSYIRLLIPGWTCKFKMTDYFWKCCYVLTRMYWQIIFTKGVIKT